MWKYTNDFVLVAGKINCRVMKPGTFNIGDKIKHGFHPVFTGQLYDCHKWLRERGEKILR